MGSPPRPAKRAARAEREATDVARGRTRAVREAPEATWTPPGFGRALRSELGAGRLAGTARLHTGTSADRLTSRLGAHAFTHGRDVVLADTVAPLRTPWQLGVLAHELAHVEQQRGRPPVVQAYIDPTKARIDEAKLEAETDGDMLRMQSEVIAELKGTPRNQGDSEWNLAIIQTDLRRRNLPVTPFTVAHLATKAEDQATPDQIKALQTRIELVSALASKLFPGSAGTLTARLADWSKEFEKLHKDAVFDQGEKIVAIQTALEAAARIKAGIPEEESADPELEKARVAVNTALSALIRDLGTGAQATRTAALAKAAESYTDVMSKSMIGAAATAQEMMAGKDSAPPPADDLFVNGYGRDVPKTLVELGTYDFKRDDVNDDFKVLGDLKKLKNAPYAERAAFMDKHGKDLPKLMRRAQALALMRSAMSAGSALMSATIQKTNQVTAHDMLDIKELRNRVVVPLAKALESDVGPTDKDLIDARRTLDRLDESIRARLKDVNEYQQKVGAFVQFAVMALSLYGGAAAMRMAVPMTPGATMTFGSLVRGSLAFTSASMLITAGLTDQRLTPEQMLMQYATDLATFGLMHGIGMGLSSAYGGANKIPAIIKAGSEVGALWAWSAGLGIAAHVDQGKKLDEKAATQIASDAAKHTALGLMAMHLGHHVGSLPGMNLPEMPTPAERAKAQAAVAEFERVRNEGKAVERDLQKWREAGEVPENMDPVLGRAEKFYGSYRKAVRGLADAKVIEGAQAAALIGQAAPLQTVRNIRVAAKLGLRSSGEHTVGYSADVKNVDLFLRQLQRQGTVKSFEPTGRAGIYRVEQSDGSWALWFPEAPAAESSRGFDLPSQVVGDAYPNLPPEVRAKALANLSRLPVAEGNRALAMLGGPEGEALVKWLARSDVAGQRFLTGEMLEQFLKDPATRASLDAGDPKMLERWYDVPFEKITGDRSGASFMKFIAMVRSYRGHVKVSTRAEALAIAGELVGTAEAKQIVVPDKPTMYLGATGTPAPAPTPLEHFTGTMRDAKIKGTFHEVVQGDYTYMTIGGKNSLTGVAVYHKGVLTDLILVSDQVKALQDGIASADAIAFSDPVGHQAALAALEPIAKKLAFLRDVRGLPVGDVVPLINRVMPRAARPLPDVLPPEPPAAATAGGKPVPITRAEAARHRRQMLLDRAEQMGEAKDAMIASLREWNPDVPGSGKTGNPEMLMSAVEGYLDALTTRRVGSMLKPPASPCFAAATPVWTERGPAPIVDVTGGATVVAVDGEGGERPAAVTHQFRAAAARSLQVRLSDGSVIHTTDEHPFWVPGRGWRGAGLLAAGDRLWARRGPLHVVAIDDAGPCEVWNLEVAAVHTYLVGDAGVLVHNKAMPALTSAANLRLIELFADRGYTYRNGGTGVAETELTGRGAKVVKTTDPETGLKTLTVTVPGQKAPIVLRERGRYADVRLAGTTLPPAEQARVDALYTEFGINDPAHRGRVLEAIEVNRMTSGGDPVRSIEQGIQTARRWLEAAAKEGRDSTPVKTVEEVLNGRGEVPITDAESTALLPKAQEWIDRGILNDPRFLEARDRAEIKDILAEPAMRDTAERRATKTHGLKGGEIVTRMRILGNTYTNRGDTTPRKTNVDVSADLDVAYVVENQGSYEIQYGANAKTGPGSSGDAANQNMQAKTALTTTGRFQFRSRDGVLLWGEVTRVEATMMDGTVMDMTGKVAWGNAAVTETMGPHRSGGYDTTMGKGTEVSSLDRLADLIWRMRELHLRGLGPKK